MTDPEVLFTEAERETLCSSPDCSEHSDGNLDCPIPSTRDEAVRRLEKEAQSASTHVMDVEPTKATAEVYWSDSASIEETSNKSELCLSEQCEDHADGESLCLVPDTWGELREMTDNPVIRIPESQK